MIRAHLYFYNITKVAEGDSASSESDPENAPTRGRRSCAPVSLKEPALNTKMRRERSKPREAEIVEENKLTKGRRGVKPAQVSVSSRNSFLI